MFTRFHRECVGTAERFSYQGLVHRAGGLFEDKDFLSPGENAIVDFKYTASPKLTWWFDHHQSAFMTPGDLADFERGQVDGSGSPGPRAMRQFFDPNYISCTGFIAEVAGTKFGMELEPLAELIRWANIVDGAKYPSAKDVVEMVEPAYKLTMVIESSADETVIPRLIPLLTELSLQDVLEQPFVQEQLGPLMQRHVAGIGLIGERAKVAEGVITFDIMDKITEGYSKFIPYYLHPEATYTVGLSKSSFRTKISVGTNPWTTRASEELVNIAEICERYGGGGHARVGAISFPPDREDLAREAAGVITAELRKA